MLTRMMPYLNFSQQRRGVRMMGFWILVKMISSLVVVQVTKQMQMMNGQIRVQGI
jgi:branched-subunit amino acid transport protein AzlD